jgi:hypothetical protein
VLLCYDARCSTEHMPEWVFKSGWRLIDGIKVTHLHYIKHLAYSDNV